MSGNPFRRQRLPDETTYNEELGANSAAKTKPKKKKRVVIQTPPHSPEEPHIPRRLSDGRTGSPPPPVTQIEDEETDSTTGADSALEQALVKTGFLPPPATTFGVQTGSRAPPNPFARTLATSEAAFGLRQEQEKPVGSDGVGQEISSAGRPVLDVDAFKNILMTGSATASPPTANQSQRPQDNSSNTDASSMSRQSIFDTLHELHPESPRTSFDDHAQSDDDNGDDEHSSLMGPISSRPVEEGPPAPPKPKYGRVYPQTVSFAEFDENIPPARLQTPPINTQISPLLNAPRSPSDLNKPLPPPPAEKSSSDDTAYQEQDATPTASQPFPQFDAGSQAKKAAPAPPVSRRRGQGEGSTGRPRSESNLSRNSIPYSDAGQSTIEDQPAKLAPPPPPPSRRVQPISNSPSPAVETPPSIPSPAPDPAPAETKHIPLPPPRRQPSKRAPSVNRTPSAASRTSLPRSDSFTNTASTSGHAPPAPPPRRGAAKHNSMDVGPPNSLAMRHSSGDRRRASGQSFDSERSVSISSLQQVAEPGENEEAVESAVAEKPPARSVLADLDAFQAEIDALRVKAARNG